MRVALITTTINVPTVLALYRKLGPDVMMFVASDEKTPNNEVSKFFGPLSDNKFECYCDTLNQKALGYKCSELLGWNNDSRRNIALLEAVKWGAEIIVSIDDDMIPLGQDFFERFEIMLSEPYSGPQVSAPTWVNVGEFTLPHVPQRGLPGPALSDYRWPHVFSSVTDAQIGVMQGIILGVPDTNAFAGSSRPFVHTATDILRHGFVVHPEAKAVFNSQITAFRRELAPCFAQYYKWQKRNTDILASLVMRRVMRETNLHTYFGPPFAFHARTPAVRESDYANERPGVEIIERFSSCLDATILLPGSVCHQTQHLYDALAAAGHLPLGMHECVNAFLDDMEGVL